MAEGKLSAEQLIQVWKAIKAVKSATIAGKSVKIIMYPYTNGQQYNALTVAQNKIRSEARRNDVQVQLSTAKMTPKELVNFAHNIYGAEVIARVSGGNVALKPKQARNSNFDDAATALVIKGAENGIRITFDR